MENIIDFASTFFPPQKSPDPALQAELEHAQSLGRYRLDLQGHLVLDTLSATEPKRVVIDPSPRSYQPMTEGLAKPSPNSRLERFYPMWAQPGIRNETQRIIPMPHELRVIVPVYNYHF